MSQHSDDKARLRRHFRDLRSEVTRTRRQAWAAQLNRHLLAAGPIEQARSVAAYLAFDGEPDIRFSLTQLHRRGVRVGLPVLGTGGEQTLSFRSWTPATPLNANAFGISEPHGTAEVSLADTDVVLLPLVAFDRRGGRLGMGGGWYDRTLGAMAAQPLKLGVAWSFQEADALPRDEWDVPLDGVVTEREWFTCENGNATMTGAPNRPTGDLP